MSTAATCVVPVSMVWSTQSSGSNRWFVGSARTQQSS